MQRLIIMFFLLFCSMNIKAQTKAKEEILSSFCHFTISKELMKKNSVITDGYIFKISEIGKPFEIKRFLGKYFNEEEVIACLSDWRIRGFQEGTRFYVRFTWENGKGWTQMKINSKGFSQTTLLDDNSSNLK